MTQENLAIILNRANCCIAEKALQLSKLWSIGSKCYKEELRNLKILNDSVDVLLNQAFTQNSIFTIILTTTDYNFYTSLILTSSEYVVIKINGVDYNLYGNNSSNALDLILSYFESLGYTITSTGPLGEKYEFKIETPCDINTLQIDLSNTNVIYGQSTFTIPIDTPLPFDGYYYISATGTLIGEPILANSPATLESVIDNLLNTNTVGLTYDVQYTETDAIITINTTCEYFNIQLQGQQLVPGELYSLYADVVTNPLCDTLITYNNIQSGICQGCLTEEQINTLIERVMSICSICNCELDNL